GSDTAAHSLRCARDAGRGQAGLPGAQSDHAAFALGLLLRIRFRCEMARAGGQRLSQPPVVSALNMRPGGPRPRYRGAISVWLMLVAAPAGAQVSPLTGQSLFYYQANNNYSGNYLAADGGVIYTDNVQRSGAGSGEALLMAGLSGDLSREGSRLDYHLASKPPPLKYTHGPLPARVTRVL